MGKLSVRKQKKQKERERRVSANKLLIADRKLYTDKFPAFEYHMNNAPAGFVELIRRTIRTIDFRDRTLFHPKEIDFLKLLKSRPEAMTPALIQQVGKHNLAAIHLATMVGQRVFARIPSGQLRQWIPYHDVQFLMAGETIEVVFRSLESVMGNGGRIYFSPHRPALEINGQQKIVGWSRHAIERTCERFSPRWDSYQGLGDVFSFFHQCRRFDPCLLNGDKTTGFTFYDSCVDGFFSGHIGQQVLGRVSKSLCYYRVGYCPVVIDGDFAKATTLLYPGYEGTPEYGLILRYGLAGETRSQLIETARRMTREELGKTQDFRLMKMFHENGVPQVIETDSEFFFPF